MSISAEDIVHIQLEKFEEACNSIGHTEEKNKNLRDQISELLIKNKSQKESMANLLNKNINLVNKIGKALLILDTFPEKPLDVTNLKEILEL